MAHNVYLKGFFLVSAFANILFLKNRSEKALNLAKTDNFSILGLLWRPVLLP